MATRIVNDLRSHYRAWGRGKGTTSERFIELLTDDATFRSIGGGANLMEFTRTHRTKDDVRAYFAGLARDWEMLFYNVSTFLVQNGTVAVMCECAWKHKQTGKTVHTPKLDVIRIKDGKIADFFEFFDNHQAAAACRAEGECTVPADPKPFNGQGQSRLETEVTVATRANVNALKHLYAQYAKTKGASIQSILELLAPNVVWGSLSAGTYPLAFSRTHRSREEVAEYFRGLSEAFTMNYYDVREYVAAGPYVLALSEISFTNKKTGKTFVSPKADFWRFAGGKAVEFYEFFDTAAVMASAA
ncbi:nuclear transport factor 2 family protein [Nordella sp. HKS 07]|uniref:nuclear transport factor 2 family protein n=1 Tax=Nordella sp. HKS 07 TaxID=2712222 RepID=UPI0013E19B18|nr:nuclear transport factor 2 family protein [Nordella sp. HKS 07]QIG51557.1 nuclear transport factor 2 family protein [Nordella sp. HKS 07]